MCMNINTHNNLQARCVGVGVGVGVGGPMYVQYICILCVVYIMYVYLCSVCVHICGVTVDVIASISLSCCVAIEHCF